jgi:hypothetical protein
MANNPQEAFLNLLIAAMADAAVNGHLSQLQTTIDPDGNGTRIVRIVVIPEKMDHTWPVDKPLGSKPEAAPGNSPIADRSKGGRNNPRGN